MNRLLFWSESAHVVKSGLAILIAVVGFAHCLAVSASQEAGGVEFFEKHIRPILVDKCYKCHSSDSRSVKGGLLLDSKEGVLKGGDSGPAIIAGNPDKSLLIRAVRYTDSDLQMPPKDKKLPAEAIAALEQWVQMGAPDPRTGKSNLGDASSIEEKSKAHWAFRPITNPRVPTTKDRRWARTPIDHFILAQLESKDLKPSSPADKRTLIRRASFDLIGLPPTEEQVELFLKDRSSDAFAKVIDEFLASPQYGERWGRHWLDVARYADTKGYLAGNEERRFPYSYTYRDWVIRSLNEDLPYDQFVRQQIAADKLNLGEDKRALAAMGFLTLGRRFLNNQHDIIDDRIDVVTRGTLALTVSCARCHDHKYDPIPTKDYYSLYGVFNSAYEPRERPLLGIDPPKEPHEQFLAERKRREEAVDTFVQQKSQEVMNQLRERVGDYLLASSELNSLPDKPNLDTFARERKLDPNVLQRWINRMAEWNSSTNAIFAPWTAFTAIPGPEFTNKVAEVLTSLSNPERVASLNPHIRQLFATNAPTSLKEIADRYGKLLADVEKQWRERLQEHAKANLGGSPPPLSDPHMEALRQVLYGENSPLNLSAGEIDDLFDVPTIEQRRELRRQVAELDAVHPGAPPRGMVLVDKDVPENPFVFIRGNPFNRGADVPRQSLEVLAGSQRSPFTNGSGRLELAQAITSKTNPLTARVMVNRVWMLHFGKGLVNTPSDFGLRSDPPTHPELLDWLAWNFMESGWSLKKLHRQIMLSAVYQQSSNDREDGLKIDPANNLLWKINRHRLEFEAMRDSLMAVSGKMEPAMGGLPVDILAQPFTGRRSVYGYIDRQNLPGVFRTFDFANPDSTSPQRYFTTVPQQALFLLNSPFVVEQARRLATNATSLKVKKENERIDFLYRRVLQREPNKEEAKSGEEFVQQQMKVAEEPVNGSPWRYGYGKFDSQKGRVVEFTPFKHFVDRRWQHSEKFPDPHLSYATLSIEGGHPGNHIHHSVIRRWISPFDGIVKIEGDLFHPHAEGDGVLGRIVSSRKGELGNWVGANGTAKTLVEQCEVRRGDIIDFVTEARTSPTHDSFKWAPHIRTVEVKYGAPRPPRSDWHATRDFDGPPPDNRPLNAWEKYAQVLLLSNEFMFVD
jgi:hypothetical protein